MAQDFSEFISDGYDIKVNASPTRRDGATRGPLKGLSSVRLRLQREAERIPVDEVGAEVLTHARKQAQLVGITNTDLVLGSEVMQWRKENVDLITRMTEEQLQDVLEVVDAYDGVRVEELAAELQSQFNFTAARAELIARDQTLKLNGDLNENAQRHAGVTHYRWSTSQDGNVRDDHSLLEGRVFSWDEPPITNQHEVDKGKPERRCHPGGDFQCRCVAIAELDEFE